MCYEAFVGGPLENSLKGGLAASGTFEMSGQGGGVTVIMALVFIQSEAAWTHSNAQAPVTPKAVDSGLFGQSIISKRSFQTQQELLESV